ncbi:MAG: DnaJ domain-containing protein, partial [bacterium]|nr:DnaJ domain-containing protein [bacterium]
MENYYEVLNVPLSATLDEIKKGYRTLAKKYHPDVCKDKKLFHTFNRITSAYKTLMDEKERILYNEKLLNVRFRPEPRSLEKKEKGIKVIYSRSLGTLARRGFFLSHITKSYRKSIDLKYDVEVFIDYEQSRKAGSFEIDVPAKFPCPECSGQDHYCRFCDGKSYIVRPVKIRVALPQAPLPGEIFEVNLSSLKQSHLTVIKAAKLRIKVNLTHP